MSETRGVMGITRFHHVSSEIEILSFYRIDSYHLPSHNDYAFRVNEAPQDVRYTKVSSIFQHLQSNLSIR